MKCGAHKFDVNAVFFREVFEFQYRIRTISGICESRIIQWPSISAPGEV